MDPKVIKEIGCWSTIVILILGAIYLESKDKDEAAGTCAFLALVLFLINGGV